MKIFATMLTAIFAASVAIPAMTASAAIPCMELPVIEADPSMPVPMIYIKLPVSIEDTLARGVEADRTGAIELESDVASGVRMAAENQLRCLGYGMDLTFIGNSTPQQRVHMFARPNIEAEVEQYIQPDSVYVAEIGTPIGLTDGRFVVDFAIIVGGDQYLQGELVFAHVDDGYYLDGSALTSEVEDLATPTVVELSKTFTREVKIINVANGDQLVFSNTEERDTANIVITNDAGETIFDGVAKAEMMVGGEDSNIFVVHDLEPGEYQVEVTFSPDDVKYGATIVVSEDAAATPIASPESTPQN